MESDEKEGKVQSATKLSDEIYTVNEVTQMLNTSTQHVWKLIKAYDIETINCNSIY